MSWKQALALGLCSVGAYKGEPVAYLYNGVRLPKLPERDETAYPYVSVCRTFGFEDVTEVYATSVPLPVHHDSMTGTDIYFHSQGAVVRSVNWTIRDGGFGEPQFREGTVNSVINPVWSNYDVFFQGDRQVEDGTLYLSATDPVPVYE